MATNGWTQAKVEAILDDIKEIKQDIKDMKEGERQYRRDIYKEINVTKKFIYIGVGGVSVLVFLITLIVNHYL